MRKTRKTFFLVCAVSFLAANLFFAGCAGSLKRVNRHRELAETAFDEGRFMESMAHIDSSAWACEDIACSRDAYRWLFFKSSGGGNDVLRAAAYESLILSHLEAATRAENNSGREMENAGATTLSKNYLAWADSLHAIRGDPFPLADALILAAEIARADSPGVAVGHLIRITAKPEGMDIPGQLRPYIDRAEAMIDEIGAEMAARYKSGLSAFEKGDSTAAIEELGFSCNAAAGFNNAVLAAECARLIAEYYRDMGQQEIAGTWTGRALLWESRVEKY